MNLNHADRPEEIPEQNAPAVPEEGTSRRSDAFTKLLRIFGWSLLILLLLRLFVVAPYGVPTGSMEPAILPGDAVLVNQLVYYIRTPEFFPFTDWRIPHLEMKGLGTLERGDVVFFLSPETERGEASVLVKRTVALPGDTVALVGGRILVNGREPEPYAGLSDGREPMDEKKAYSLLRKQQYVVVPYEGYELPLDSVTAEAWKDVLHDEGIRVDYRNRIIFLNGGPATRYRFKRDYFFALGDNSQNSRDSRHFGFVPHGNLIGQVMLVFWSSGNDGVRWERIGKVVR